MTVAQFAGVLCRSLLAPLLGAIVLSGCGSSSESRSVRFDATAYEGELAKWIGRSETELINSWGVPARSQLLSGGGQVLEYERRKEKDVACRTLFTTSLMGTIEQYRYRGTDCSPPNLDAAHR
jgi:hypothetical protein